MLFTLMSILAVLVSVTYFACLSYAFFWYEAANSSYLAYLEKLSGGRVRLLIARGILYSIYSQLLVVILMPATLWKKLWAPPPDRNSPLPTVILAHGLYHNASAWVLLRRRLMKAGYTNIYAWSRPAWKCALQELVEDFDSFVREVVRELPGRPIVLIGHSSGGLLVRAYAQDASAVDGISAVIALGAPHQGSKLAVLGFGKACIDLSYRSPAIEMLERRKMPSRIRALSLYSPIDNMVFPAEALTIPEQSGSGWIQEETRPISHIEMLYHRPTARRILDFIAEEANRREPE